MRLSCAQCQAFDRILARHRAVIALDRCGSIDLQCLLLDVMKTKSHAMKDGVFSEVQSFRNSRTKKPRRRFGSTLQIRMDLLSLEDPGKRGVPAAGWQFGRRLELRKSACATAKRHPQVTRYRLMVVLRLFC